MARYCYALPAFYPIANSNSVTIKIQTQMCNSTIYPQLIIKKILSYY